MTQELSVWLLTCIVISDIQTPLFIILLLQNKWQKLTNPIFCYRRERIFWRSSFDLNSNRSSNDFKSYSNFLVNKLTKFTYHVGFVFPLCSTAINSLCKNNCTVIHIHINFEMLPEKLLVEDAWYSPSSTLACVVWNCSGTLNACALDFCLLVSWRSMHCCGHDHSMPPVSVNSLVNCFLFR